MEAAQRKSKRAKIVIYDVYMHAMALKSLLQPGEYETETREWSKLLENQQTWMAWKTTFQEAYVAKRRAEAALEGEEKPFGGSAIFGAAAEKTPNKQLRRRGNQKTAGTAPLTNQMMDSLEGYLENISAAAIKTVSNGGPLVDLAASLEISVETVTRQQKEIKRLSKQVKYLKNRGTKAACVGKFP